MSKMACVCGHIISDVEYACPTEGWVIGAASRNSFDDEFRSKLTAFFAALSAGRRDEWLEATFGSVYPKNEPDAEVVLDLKMALAHGYELSIAECEECGRVHIQEAVGVNKYRSFAPDDGQYARLLASSVAPRDFGDGPSNSR